MQISLNHAIKDNSSKAVKCAHDHRATRYFYLFIYSFLKTWTYSGPSPKRSLLVIHFKEPKRIKASNAEPEPRTGQAPAGTYRTSSASGKKIKTAGRFPAMTECSCSVVPPQLEFEP